MHDIEQVVCEVDGSMSMEGMPLTDADKERIRRYLENPDALHQIICELVALHTVPASQENAYVQRL